MVYYIRVWFFAFVFVVLGGCISSGGDDLQQWMSELRSSTKPHVVPISEPQQFFPQEYAAMDGVVPFDVSKLTQALRLESAQASGGSDLIAPELTRRKEPLEAYPVDAMRMVGSLQMEGMPTALLTIDGLLYQVRLGNYLGQNYGRIVGITETNIHLREIVQDSLGDWGERMIVLELQELNQ